MPKYLDKKRRILNSVKRFHILEFGAAIHYLKTGKMKNFEKRHRAPLRFSPYAKGCPAK